MRNLWETSNFRTKGTVSSHFGTCMGKCNQNHPQKEIRDKNKNGCMYLLTEGLNNSTQHICMLSWYRTCLLHLIPVRNPCGVGPNCHNTEPAVRLHSTQEAFNKQIMYQQRDLTMNEETGLTGEAGRVQAMSRADRRVQGRQAMNHQGNVDSRAGRRVDTRGPGRQQGPKTECWNSTD